MYFATQMCSSKLLLSVTEGHRAVPQETYGQVPMTVICWSGRQEWLLTQIAKQSKIESQLLMHSLSHRLNEHTQLSVFFLVRWNRTGHLVESVLFVDVESIKVFWDFFCGRRELFVFNLIKQLFHCYYIFYLIYFNCVFDSLCTVC